jgi:hypothetical protein
VRGPGSGRTFIDLQEKHHRPAGAKLLKSTAPIPSKPHATIEIIEKPIEIIEKP